MTFKTFAGLTLRYALYVSAITVAAATIPYSPFHWQKVLARAAYAAEQPAFEMTDGYFLGGSAKPAHLVHTPVDKQKMWLGEELQFWFDLELREKVDNPCSDSEEKPCDMEFGLTNSFNEDCPRCINPGLRIRGNSRTVSVYSNYPVSRKQPKGENRFLFRIKKDGNILFSYEIPVEVR